MTETTHEALLRQTGAAEELLTYFQGQRAQFNQNVADAQAGFDALANDLIGVSRNYRSYTATWDPTNPAPTNERGGVFQSLQALMNDAGCGAYIEVKLVAGETYEFVSNVSLPVGAVVVFAGHPSNRPTINFRGYSSNNAPVYNALYRLSLTPGSQVRFYGVSIAIDGKDQPAEIWSSANSIIQQGGHGTGRIEVGLDNCVVSGSDGVSVVKTHVGNIAMVGVYLCSFDGVMSVIGHLGGGSGLGMLSPYSVTYTNGATATTNGVVGTNYLEG